MRFSVLILPLLYLLRMFQRMVLVDVEAISLSEIPPLNPCSEPRTSTSNPFGIISIPEGLGLQPQGYCMTTDVVKYALDYRRNGRR